MTTASSRPIADSVGSAWGRADRGPHPTITPQPLPVGNDDPGPAHFLAGLFRVPAVGHEGHSIGGYEEGGVAAAEPREVADVGHPDAEEQADLAPREDPQEPPDTQIAPRWPGITSRQFRLPCGGGRAWRAGRGRIRTRRIPRSGLPPRPRSGIAAGRVPGARGCSGGPPRRESPSRSGRRGPPRSNACTPRG